MVAFADHLLVVLYHHYGVALVPQPFEGVDELAVVSLVESDARLVKDIQNVHQFAANLGCKPYALALSAAESAGCTVQ